MITIWLRMIIVYSSRFSHSKVNHASTSSSLWPRLSFGFNGAEMSMKSSIHRSTQSVSLRPGLWLLSPSRTHQSIFWRHTKTTQRLSNLSIIVIPKSDILSKCRFLFDRPTACLFNFAFVTLICYFEKFDGPICVISSFNWCIFFSKSSLAIDGISHSLLKGGWNELSKKPIVQKISYLSVGLYCWDRWDPWSIHTFGML